MAQADTSIYNALLQPAKSALDWQNAYAAQDDARQARQMNALQLQSTQGKLQDESQARADQAAYRSMLRPGMTPDEQITAAESSGNPYAMAQAQALRKARLEAGHVLAQTSAQTAIAGKNAAETQAFQLKSEAEKHDKAIGEIMSFNSPAEAMQSLQRHAAEGSIGQQEAQGISRQLMGLSTPEQWKQWQDQTLYKLQDAKGKAELQLKRLEYQLRRDNQVSEVANRNLIPGAAPGQFVPNAPLIEAKKQIAQAGVAPMMAYSVHTNPVTGDAMAIPNKGAPGQPLNAIPINVNGQPMKGPDQNKPTADYLKQAEAYRNMDDALTNFTAKLRGFKNSDMLIPTKRAEIATAYNNAMLQGKEIYKLGVLNGGDERILNGILANPISFTGATLPTDAMQKQARDLQAIIARANENLATVNRQQRVPLKSEAGAAPDIPAKVIKFDADGNMVQ